MTALMLVHQPTVQKLCIGHYCQNLHEISASLA